MDWAGMRRSVGGGLTRGAAPRSGRLLWTKEEWKLFWTLPSERASEGDDEDSLPPSSFHSQSHTQMSGRSGRLSVREGPDSGLDGRRRRWNRSLRSRGQFYLGVGQVGGALAALGKKEEGRKEAKGRMDGGKLILTTQLPFFPFLLFLDGD